MNKYLLKALYFVLVLAIAVSALGACSEKPDTATTSSDISSEASSTEEPSSEETSSDETSDDAAEDVWYDDLEDTEADDEYEYDDTLKATLNIYNAEAVQDDFMGFGGVYHAFPFRRDDRYGRNYTDKMSNAEIKRVINSGITMARTYYSIDDSWDSKAKDFNWGSTVVK